MARIAIAPDLHAGDVTHNVGMARQNELLAVCRRIAETCLALTDVDRLVLAGDTFHSSKPQTWAWATVGAMLAAVGRSIPVSGFRGNHDTTPVDGIAPLAALMDTSGVGTFHNLPCLLPFDGDGADVALLPWASRVLVAARMDVPAVRVQHNMMVELIGEALRELPWREGHKRVVVTHFTISGASYSTDAQPELGESTEFMLPRSVFNTAGIDLVVSGHIHKRQTVDSEPRIAYVGSQIRHDFGEENQPTGFAVLDTETLELEYVDTPALEMVTYPADWDEAMLATDFVAAVDGSPKGKLVRLKGELPAGQESVVKIERVQQALADAGALKVAKPAVHFTRHEAVRAAVIAPELTTHDQLRQYTELVAGDYADRRDDVLAMHDEFIGELAGGVVD